ncbi:MAG: hypothetical protein J1E81_05120 [Eubacterium sp.]|nr:hypothetical protein [Eubacterium sp.]
MSAKKTRNPRGRVFCLVLYPENEEHQRVIDLLKRSYNILGICHDRDTYEEDNEETGAVKGERKKLHHHIIVKFENARYLVALSNELDCEPNLIQKVDSFEGMAKYLLHTDYPQKARYQKCELYGLLIDEAIKVLDKKSADVQLCEIIEFLQKSRYLLPFPAFITWLCTNGYYSTYRANYSAIKDCYYYYQGRYLEKEARENDLRKFRGD